jgi:SAM-dependent methyltransferase
MSTTDQGWADYWQHDGDGGEVFVNAEGERHPALADFWGTVFARVSANARIIDIASGAGSIYAHLPAGHSFQLHAADIAEEALQALAERIRDVTTTVCSAGAVPFGDGFFDMVVSQFGIEYAGIDAFTEAARLVAPGGGLACLCHVEDGYIDSNNKAQLDEAKYVDESQFIDLCIDVTRAGYSEDVGDMQRSEAAFLPIARNIAAGMKRCRGGIHSHLFHGFRKLFEERRGYAEADTLSWLEDMRGELEKNIDRLSRMRSAALSAADTLSITKNLRSVGLQEIQFDLFTTEGNQLPVAWTLSATRSAQQDLETEK